MVVLLSPEAADAPINATWHTLWRCGRHRAGSLPGPQPDTISFLGVLSTELASTEIRDPLLKYLPAWVLGYSAAMHQ